MTPDHVAAIIARLTLAYGTRFKEQYAGLTTAQIKASWLYELRDVMQPQVAYALARLPSDWPVNALQFRDLARQRPIEALTVPRLGMGGAVPTPDERRRMEEAIRPLRAAKSPKAWAHGLRWREQQGERLTEFQRTAWRRALGFDSETREASVHAGSESSEPDLL